MIPYSRQYIDKDDIEAVVEVLKSDFLTTGPKVEEFEKKFAKYVGSRYAVSTTSGTAGLHIACLAAGLKKGEELITSPLTFASSANCAFYCEAKPVFVDINKQGLIDEEEIEKKIKKKTKIIVPVHYAGFPCNMDKIQKIAQKHNLIVIEDACHALGAKYKKSSIGDCKYSNICVFSFHPVKHITTGEGGMVTTNSKKLYEKLLLFRSHGITKNKNKFISHRSSTINHQEWYYEMQELGYNYLLTDIQCALGISQLKKIDKFVTKRRKIAKIYNRAFKGNKNIEIIKEKKEQKCSYHLYPIRVKNSKTRLKLFKFLKNKGIKSQVHYIPVYWHPYYQKIGYSKKELCPGVEDFYERELSLPLFYALTERNCNEIINILLGFFDKK